MALRVRRLIGSIIFLLLLSFVLIKTDALLERKYSISKYHDFYAQEQDFEVLFLGTSHVINAVYPMELWHDYGIVSYNLANHSENICTNYWQLVNALEHTTPKVVVVDLYAIDGTSKVNEKYLHNFTDTIPSFLTKCRTVMDLLEPKDWGEYIFEISLYHGRWEELSREDFRPEISVEKGAEIATEVEINEPPVLVPKDEFDPTDRVNKRYLQRIIDLCKKNDIEVVLTYIPYSMPESHQPVANWGYYIAEKNDIPYINFVYEDFDLNYITDCADIAHHLNASGARKVTDYLGKFLFENYNITDYRENDSYQFWHKDYDEYSDKKLEILDMQDHVWSYLMFLNDSNYKVNIYATKDSLIYGDSVIMELINNINYFGEVEFVELSDEHYEGNFQVEVIDKETKEIVNYQKFTRTGENMYDTY